MTKNFAFAGLTMLALVASLSLASAALPGPGPAPGPAVSCLPLGVDPGFQAWGVADVSSMVVASPSGAPLKVPMVRYERGTSAVVATYVDGRLLTVDPAPDDPSSGVWINGLVGDPPAYDPLGDACAWRQAKTPQTRT